MPYFLNLELSNKINKKFLLKHIIFSIIWFLGALILIFRLDLIILKSFGIDLPWLEGTLPLMLLAFTILIVVTQKWYYTIALIFYPILTIGWFIPKTVLRKGKIYLLGNYLNNIYSYFKNLKFNIVKTFSLIVAIILLFVMNQTWSRWFAILVFSSVYIMYVWKFIKNSFQPAKLFGVSVEDAFKKIILDNKESFLIKNYVLQKTDDKLKKKDRKKKQLGRLISLNYIIEYSSEQLNGFKGKRAFVISLIFSLLLFILYSIIFFWFLNYQLFVIDNSNFSISSNPSVFEFLFYTFKSVFTFGGTENITPFSPLAKIVHIVSFLILGLFLLVIVTSFVFSLKNDKINENIKLTNEVFEDQKSMVLKYVESEYKTDIQTAMSQIANIKESLTKLKSTLEKFF